MSIDNLAQKSSSSGSSWLAAAASSYSIA